MESVSGVASEKPMAYFVLELPSSGAAVLLTAVALILPTLLLWIHKKYRKMQEDNKPPFQFLELPQELRDMVYEHLLEERPAYPPPPTCRDVDVVRSAGRRQAPPPPPLPPGMFPRPMAFAPPCPGKNESSLFLASP